MLDRVKDDGIDVSPWVRDVVVVALWLPLIFVLLGIGIGILGIGVRTALHGDLPALGGFAGAVDPTLAVLGAAGAIGYVYLILANATLGTDNVEAAQDQAQEIEDDLTDGN